MAAKTVDVEIQGPLGIVRFNRPDKLNSFIRQQYIDLSDTLQELDNNKAISVILVAGTGRYYSSGHDLQEQTKQMMSLQTSGGDLRGTLTKAILEQASRLVRVLIDLKKPIIACVNGPAFGIAVTTLALMDIVYCSDAATFATPFMPLGFCAEGCSSLLFPAIMGTSKANEMLLGAKVMSAQEAERCGFVSNVFPVATVYEDVLKIAKRMASYPPNALQQTKALTRNISREQLHKVNDTELTLLVDRFLSSESINAVMRFIASQRQKKASL